MGQANYYNTFNPDNNYTILNAYPGRTLQSREVNEIQSIINHTIENLGNAIFTNGQIISGCQVIVNATHLTITQGKIFLNGKIRTVPMTELIIRGTGIENIYAKVATKEIIAKDDKTLLDPATGFENYGNEGCSRQQEIVVFTIDSEDVESTPIFALEDGVQIATEVNAISDNISYAQLADILATRSYNTNGNYIVNGFNVENKNLYNSEAIFLNVTAGLAYVQGYEVNSLSPTQVSIERTADTRRISNEPHISAGKNTLFYLNHNYCDSIIEVAGYSETTANLAHTNIRGGLDNLVNIMGSVPYAIVSVTDSGGTTYVQGRDYQLGTDGRGNIGIDWSLPGNEPEGGSTITVTWQYSCAFSNTDYDAIYDENDGKMQIIFDGKGNIPIPNTSIKVTYDYLLYRKDSVVLDRYGTIYALKGQADGHGLIEPPTVDKERYIELAQVTITPNSPIPEITLINNNNRVTMNDIYKLSNRISQLEQNLAISTLDREASESESAGDLIGVMTDSLLNYSKSDTLHSDYTAVIDNDSQLLTNDITATAIYPTIKTGGKQSGDIYTLPYNESRLLAQTVASSGLIINQYNSFPMLPIVTLSAYADNWVDKVEYPLDNGSTKETLYKWWNNSTANTSYIAERNLTININNLEPYEDNIVVKFEDKELTATGVSSIYDGTMAGTLKANRNGQAQGYITIPKDEKSGNKIITVYSKDNPSLVGYAYYASVGTSGIDIKKVYKERKANSAVAPVAQSFKFDDNDYVITSIGLFFKSKDSTNPISVEVRTMVNGQPSNIVLAESTMLAPYITIGAKNETIFKLNRPVYCKKGVAYCFTVNTASNTDSLYVAKTNEKDVSANQTITKNVYTNGELFTSSNNASWVLEPTADLTFTIYRALFNTKSTITFNDIGIEAINGIVLCASQDVPQGTNIEWQYSAGTDTNYYPINTYSEKKFNSNVTTLKLRALLNGNSYVSPAIAADSLCIGGLRNNLEGSYISRNIYVTDGYTHVRVLLDVKNTYNNSVKVYYSSDKDGLNWTELPLTSTAEGHSNGYVELGYEGDLTKQHNYRLRIDLESVVAYDVPSVQRVRSILID